MDNVYASHKPQSGGLFFKPVSGTEYTLRIVGEPVVFSNEFTAPDGEVNISTRYAWVVYNKTDKAACILQLPSKGYRMIYDLATSEWGNPETYDVAYRKTGEKLTTVHSVQPKPKSVDLTDEQLTECQKIELKEMISKSPGSSHVMYISEANDSVSGYVQAKAKADELRQSEDVDVLNDVFPE